MFLCYVMMIACADWKLIGVGCFVLITYLYSILLPWRMRKINCLYFNYKEPYLVFESAFYSIAHLYIREAQLQNEAVWTWLGRLERCVI